MSITIRGKKLPMIPRPGAIIPSCPRCWTEVTMGFISVPSKWSLIKVFMFHGKRLPSIWMELRPCGHVLLGEEIENYTNAILTANGVDLKTLVEAFRPVEQES